MNRILLGSAVTVLLLAGCGDEKKTTAEATKVATEQTTTKEVVAEATKDVAQTVTKAATEVTNTVTEATNKVVENTSEAVKETTANVMETAKEVVSASDTTVKEAANTTSKKISFIFSANSLSTVPLTATTPPNAETGSHLSASTYESNKVSLIANPQGFPCFTIQTALSFPKAAAILAAPEISPMLLNDASPFSVLNLFENCVSNSYKAPF